MQKLQERLAQKRANNEQGFTLIELLVVIVILGILAAVVVFSVRGIVDRGDKSACEATKTAILTGAEAAYAQSSPSAYPASLGALVAGGFLTKGGGTLGGAAAPNETTFNGKNFTITYALTGTPALPTLTTTGSC
jgi:prepilin-type N-terminal cleavage/methylation domain-containing protein